jgi:hypothetical protein
MKPSDIKKELEKMHKKAADLSLMAETLQLLKTCNEHGHEVIVNDLDADFDNVGSLCLECKRCHAIVYTKEMGTWVFIKTSHHISDSFAGESVTDIWEKYSEDDFDNDTPVSEPDTPAPDSNDEQGSGSYRVSFKGDEP